MMDRVVGTTNNDLAGILSNLEDSFPKLDLILGNLCRQQSTQVPASNNPIIPAVPLFPLKKEKNNDEIENRVFF